VDGRGLTKGRQIIGGIGWTIALLAAAGFVSLIVFTDMHRSAYERVPARNLLAVASAVLVGLGLVAASRKAGRKN
jgi:uncharacterized membrane protein